MCVFVSVGVSVSTVVSMCVFVNVGVSVGRSVVVSMCACVC